MRQWGTQLLALSVLCRGKGRERLQCSQFAQDCGYSQPHKGRAPGQGSFCQPGPPGTVESVAATLLSKVRLRVEWTEVAARLASGRHARKVTETTLQPTLRRKMLASLRANVIRNVVPSCDNRRSHALSLSLSGSSVAKASHEPPSFKRNMKRHFRKIANVQTTFQTRVCALPQP